MKPRVCLLAIACIVILAGTFAGAAGAEPPEGPDLCDAALCSPLPPPPPPPPPPSYVPIGWFDTVDTAGTAYGWACDANDFGAALAIHFYLDAPAGVGGSFIGSTTANAGREAAVAANCGGNPNHGFVFNLPDAVRDGVTHALYAYAINIGPEASNPLLDGSPQWFTLERPPDLNVQLWPEAFSSNSSEVVYSGGVRCKKYAFTQHYTQAGLYRVMRYEGGFGVCYRYNGGIVSVSYRVGDAYWICCGWEWRGNETGYPFHIREAHKVTFAFRGKMAFCVTRFGCGPQRYPWITLTFYDNNTVTRDVGVA